MSQELCWGECRRSEGVNARCKGNVTKKLGLSGQSGQKGNQSEPKGAKREPKESPTGAKSEPKAAKGSQKGAKGDQKGAKRVPKEGPWSVLGRPGGSSGQNIKKIHWILTILGSILDTFRHQFATISGVCRIALRCVAVRREVARRVAKKVCRSVV